MHQRIETCELVEIGRPQTIICVPVLEVEYLANAESISLSVLVPTGEVNEDEGDNPATECCLLPSLRPSSNVSSTSSTSSRKLQRQHLSSSNQRQLIMNIELFYLYSHRYNAFSCRHNLCTLHWLFILKYSFIDNGQLS